MEWKPCVKCGKRASHVQLPERFLCCKCHVEEGNPPADWHLDCMRTFQHRVQATAATPRKTGAKSKAVKAVKSRRN